MTDVRPWARVVGDVNVSVRRGAWYEVVRLTPEAAVIDIKGHSLSIPRSTLEIVNLRPRQWSVVPRPYDAVDLPLSWGSRYGVCPACSARAPLAHQIAKLQCPRCNEVFAVHFPLH